MRRLGVDVGGTFTDLILVDEDAGVVTVDKVPSTPDDPARGVVAGVDALCAKAGVGLSEVENVLHSTTVATNLVLTHSGADVGMITTEGFRDVVHIARAKKPHNFSLQQELPWQSRPLVPRRQRLTVSERVTVPDGDVLVPLDDAEVRARVRTLAEAGVEAVAVCLLHSYLNPTHEQQIKEIVLDEFPEAYVSVSHEVLPLYREFERFSTVCLNAYIGPTVARYVERFDKALRERGFDAELQLIQSSGGMATVEGVTRRPVNTLMSGPVAGLLGGIWAGRMAARESVITLDMGGTSADIGVAAGGQLRMRHLLDTKVGDYNCMVPMVDIDAIGAGGGSIAYVDDGGVFRVGPRSAGADPGPACYGRAGTDATSTDAQVVLGRLRPERGLLGGEMRLDEALAAHAINTVADRLEMTVEEAALGALQIQKFGMTQAIELNSVRRGYDPREFALVAGGGAGPLFACEIARELEIPTVVVPPHPGITSATGLLATDLQHEFVATERQPIKGLDLGRLSARFDELVAQALRQLDADGVADERRAVLRQADCRYSGQGYEVRFDVPGGAVDEAWVARLEEAFHAAHEREYGHRFDTEIEIINVRVVAVGKVDELRWAEIESGGSDPSAARRLESGVVFDIDGRPERLTTPFYERGLLAAGNRIDGPAVIEQYDATTVVPPGFSVEVDRFGNLVIDCRRAGAGAKPAAAFATPILMRVIGGAFQAIAKEMAGVLYRMSYSSIIREAEDLGAGIFDAAGNELAESDSTPMFMAAMPKIVKGVLELLGDDINEGDIILHNDPYLGATHSPDVGIVMPVIFEGELVGFTGASAHLIDIGGAYPGVAVDLVDLWAEGNIYRAVKLSDRGVRQEKLWKHILENTRTPTHNRGDIEAMIAACELGRRRYLALLETYGRDAVLGVADDWLAYSERMLRREIAKAPDGVYEAPIGWLDDDGRNRGVKLPIKVTVTISGDEITFDLTGSSDEVETGYNCAFEGSTMSFMTFITRTIFLDEAVSSVFVPQNEGMLTPVNVIAPKGSIFNPNFPRSCFARGCQLQRVVDLALKALAPILPDQVTAGNSAHYHFFSYSGFKEGAQEYWVHLEGNEGSYGGRQGRDGLDSVTCLIVNLRNNPVEELEWSYPIRTERYELRDDPCAAGRWRGGIGPVRVHRFLVDTMVSCEAERHESDPPWGIFGGADGLNASVVKNRGRDGQESWPSKVTGLRLEPGDALEITGPSSGGYGDPLEREPELVLSDVLDGFTSLELAERDYGVVIDAETMALDPDRTGRVREGRRKASHSQQLKEGPISD